MKAIFQNEVQPHLRRRFGAEAYCRRELLASCPDESLLAPILEEVSRAHPKVYLKSRARPFEEGVRLRLTLTARGREEAEAKGYLREAVRALGEALSAIGIELEDTPGGTAKG
jgi:molybdopterin-biosynthesis enzyme MoeA-like protein